MFAMRLARPDDVPAVAAVITARSEWMEQQGLPSWREAVDDLAGQAAVAGTLMWVLIADEQVIGCTTLADDRPAWGWTPEQAAQDAFYLFTTCTHPEWRHAKPGSLIAWWAVDKAARNGKTFVRRGTVEASLMRYYATQGFQLVHEVQRKNNLVYLMARRAQRLPEVERMFAAGSAVLIS
jgi:predicted N-acetyltransferase YhbS